MFRSTKRGAAVVAALAVVALTLTGCGRTDDNGADAQDKNGGTLAEGPATGSLTVWAMGAEGEMLDGFLDAYRAENPDVSIEVTPVPWNAAEDMFETAIAAGTTPDVAMMGTTQMARYNHAFDTVPQGIDTSGFFTGSLATVDRDGSSVGVPWYVDTRVLYYRTDLAQQAGWDAAPETFGEFTGFLTAIKGVDGVTWPMLLTAAGQSAFQDNLWAPFSAGASLTNDDGTAWTLDTPEMAAGMEFFASLFADGLVNPQPDPTPGYVEGEFVAGRAGAFISGPWMRGVLEDLGLSADQYATALIPADQASSSFIGGANLVVFEESANKDAAWQLVDWLTSDETQLEFFNATGNMPSSQAVWDAPELQADPNFAVFGDQMPTAIAPPVLSTWTEVASELDRQVERVILGQTSVQDALTAMQSQADSIGMGD